MLLRYLFRSTLLRLGLALPALCLLIMAFDLGDQGRRLARGLGWAPVLLASLHHLPLYAVQVLPVALVLALILTLSGMSQRGELEAMACAGLSTRRLAFTLLLTGLMATSLALILGELVVPPLERRADTLYAHLRISSLTGESQAAPWLRLGPWYLGHSPDGQLLGLKVDRGHRLVQRLAGPSLRQQAPARVAEAQALWSRSLGRPEAQSSMELWRRLRSLRGAGHTRPVETLVLHTKLAYPVVNLVAALLVCILTLPFFGPAARLPGSGSGQGPGPDPGPLVSHRLGLAVWPQRLAPSSPGRMGTGSPGRGGRNRWLEGEGTGELIRERVAVGQLAQFPGYEAARTVPPSSRSSRNLEAASMVLSMLSQIRVVRPEWGLRSTS